MTNPTDQEREALDEALKALDKWTAMTLPEGTARAVARDRLERALAAREEPHAIDIVASRDTFCVQCSCGWSDIRFTRSEAESKGSKHLIAVDVLRIAEPHAADVEKALHARMTPTHKYDVKQRNAYRDGFADGLAVREDTERPPRRCPDDATCHHGCSDSCWRVSTCVPLTASGWDDWPDEIKRANPAREDTERPDGELAQLHAKAIKDSERLERETRDHHMQKATLLRDTEQ